MREKTKIHLQLESDLFNQPTYPLPRLPSARLEHMSYLCSCSSKGCTDYAEAGPKRELKRRQIENKYYLKKENLQILMTFDLNVL